MHIIIGAGGSGGHVFPALETAKRLKKDRHQVTFLTTGGLAFELIRRHGFDAWIIDPPRVKSSFFVGIIRQGWRMLAAINEARRLLGCLSADVVVGFGGYGAFPVVVAAMVQRTPTLIHEQNVILSRSNKILSGFVDRIALSFDQSRRYFSSKNVVITGCPCRDTPPSATKEEIYRSFGFSEHRPTLFVLGGSQGSRRINEEFSKAVAMLQGGLDFQFIHICGKADYPWLQKEYGKVSTPYQLFDFFDDVPRAYVIADLVIARSGAATVSEILSFHKRAILVPYPIVHVHQKENAQVALEQGLARIVDDSACTALRLKDEVLNALSSDPNGRDKPAGIHRGRDEEPQEKIAREIIRLALCKR